MYRYLRDISFEWRKAIGAGLRRQTGRQQGLQRQIGVGAACIDQLIIRRENRSIATARHKKPPCVQIYVMLETQNWSGASTPNALFRVFVAPTKRLQP